LGVVVGTSTVVGCRTVAMLHYRPDLYLGHDWATEPLIHPEDAPLSIMPLRRVHCQQGIPEFALK
jgi:hypothetical protein